MYQTWPCDERVKAEFDALEDYWQSLPFEVRRQLFIESGGVGTVYQYQETDDPTLVADWFLVFSLNGIRCSWWGMHDSQKLISLLKRWQRSTA